MLKNELASINNLINLIILDENKKNDSFMYINIILIRTRQEKSIR